METDVRDGVAEILVVDDRQENQLSIEAVLGSDAYRLVRASSGDEALRYLLTHDPALILMDVQMPGLDGFETAALIKSNERTREIPIIFITAISKDEAFTHKGYAHGAVDYIYKPFDSTILQAKVAVFAELRRQHQRIARLVAVQRAATQALGEAANADTGIAKVLASICETLDWDVGLFWQVHQRANSIWCQAAWHGPHTAASRFVAQSMQTSFAPNSDLPGIVWATGKAAWIVDLAQDAGFSRRDNAVQDGLRTAVGLPICVQGETVGIIEFFSRRQLDQDFRLTEIMESIGSQIGQVLKRSEAVAQTRASEASRAAILDTALDCIISIDHQGNVVEFNGAAERTFGYQRADVLGREMASVIIPPALRDKHRHGMTRYLTTGDSHVINQRIEVTALRVDGTVFPVELAITRVPDVEPPLMTAFLRDITQRKLIEKNAAFLAEATNTLSASLDYEETFSTLAGLVVNSLADWCAIDVIDAEGNLQPIAFAHPDPVKRNTVYELRRKYPMEKTALQGAPRVVQTGRSELYQHLPHDLLMEVPFEAADVSTLEQLGLGSGMIVPLIARTRILGAITLISGNPNRLYTADDLHVAEELARRAAIAIDNASLYRDAKEALHARDEFFSIASHELKTPITSLKMLLQIAERGLKAGGAQLPSPEKLAKTLNTCNRQIEQLTHLIENLLDIVKIREGKLSFNFEEVNFSELLEELMQRYATAFVAAQCPIEMAIEPDVVGHWDRLRLEQVVVNLMSNAIKYAPGAPIRVALHKTNDIARLTIQDAGPGIPADQQWTIFKRFERGPADRNVTGLGLGLFIVKQVVEAHQGTIHLDSSERQGAAFVVDLPTVPGAPDASHETHSVGVVSIR